MFAIDLRNQILSEEYEAGKAAASRGLAPDPKLMRQGEIYITRSPEEIAAAADFHLQLGVIPNLTPLLDYAQGYISGLPTFLSEGSSQKGSSQFDVKRLLSTVEGLVAYYGGLRGVKPSVLLQTSKVLDFNNDDHVQAYKLGWAVALLREKHAEVIHDSKKLPCDDARWELFYDAIKKRKLLEELLT